MISSVTEVIVGGQDVDQLDVLVVDPAGRRIERPAFRSGDGRWRVRFRTEEAGDYRVSAAGEPDQVVQVASAARAPAPRLRREGRHLTGPDGPFLWLADTWWFALCDRVTSAELSELARRRADQGFTVVHVVAGLLPEVSAYEDLGELAGRWAWQPDWADLDPDWWAAADERIELIIEHGLVPAIVGSWSYYLLELGVERMTRHWREVIARWGAHPVVWCIAGEAGLPYYADLGKPAGESASRALIRDWQTVLGRVADLDGYGSVRTIHPFPPRGLSGTDMIDDPSLLDLVWLQTGHSDHWDIEPTLATVEREAVASHGLPVINSEVCYEGILGGSEAALQRYFFYSHLLRGAAGHSYGAQGLWAFRRAEDRGPGLHWGGRTWQQAAELPGAEQLGRGAALLRSLDWASLRPAGPSARPQAGPQRRGLPYVARSADTVVAYLPSAAMAGPASFRELSIDGLSPDWAGAFHDPRTGAAGPELTITPEPDGTWLLKSGDLPTREDWLLVLRRR